MFPVTTLFLLAAVRRSLAAPTLEELAARIDALESHEHSEQEALCTSNRKHALRCARCMQVFSVQGPLCNARVPIHDRRVR